MNYIELHPQKIIFLPSYELNCIIKYLFVLNIKRQTSIYNVVDYCIYIYIHTHLKHSYSINKNLYIDKR